MISLSIDLHESLLASRGETVSKAGSLQEKYAGDCRVSQPQEKPSDSLLQSNTIGQP
jgi:hypothetical protein